MKYLSELQKKKVFGLEFAEKLTGNRMTAKSMLQSYKKAGYITSIRRDLYAAVDLATGDVIANRFEIGCAAVEGAYVSHHTALEFHGTANQVYYKMTVSSGERFTPFSFNGIDYVQYKPKIKGGVIKPRANSLVAVTDIERTIADCIYDIDLAGGWEEVEAGISLLPEVKEEKLISYLEEYNQVFLWQKTGFLMERLNPQFHLSSSFFEECKKHIHQRKKYLVTGRELIFSPEWKLYVPKSAPEMELTEGGELV